MKTLLMLLLACLFCRAQDTLQFKVTGSVKNIQDKNPVFNCPIVLKGSDGTLMLFKTDSAGNYTINLRSETTYEIYTNTDKTVTTPTAKFGFLATDDHGLFTTIGLKESQHFQKDFELQPVTCCEYRLPLFIFKKGSVVLDTMACRDYEDVDPTKDHVSNNFEIFVAILQKNPTIVLELSAHCSSEETVSAEAADKLSAKRAEYIKAELVKRGIPPERLVPKGWGERKLKITDAQIAKEKTKAGKEALHSMNRRVVFKILSWDYSDPNANKTEIPKYYSPSKGEDKVLPTSQENPPRKRMKENKLETPKDK